MRTHVHRLALQLFGRLPRGLRRRLVRLGTPGYTVGAMCRVERTDGRILLIRQTYRQGWGLPGGLLARHEDPADGARREVAEEVGIEVELVGEPSVVVASRLHRVDVVFRSRPGPGVDPDATVADPAEIAAVGWFDPVALPELQPETASALVALARRDRDTLGGDVQAQR